MRYIGKQNYQYKKNFIDMINELNKNIYDDKVEDKTTNISFPSPPPPPPQITSLSPIEVSGDISRIWRYSFNIFTCIKYKTKQLKNMSSTSKINWIHGEFLDDDVNRQLNRLLTKYLSSKPNLSLDSIRTSKIIRCFLRCSSAPCTLQDNKLII